jgi:hypothetical protein
MSGKRVPKNIWHKSSFSESGACVEARETADSIQVRDSMDRSGPVLTFTFSEWRSLLVDITRGECPCAQTNKK